MAWSYPSSKCKNNLLWEFERHIKKMENMTAGLLWQVSLTVRSAMHHNVGGGGLNPSHTPGTTESHVQERAESHIPGNNENHTPVSMGSGVCNSKDTRSFGASTPSRKVFSPVINVNRGRSTPMKRKASVLSPEKQQGAATITTTAPPIIATNTTKTRDTTVFPSSTRVPLDSPSRDGGTSSASQTPEMETAHPRQTRRETRKLLEVCQSSVVSSQQSSPDVVVLDAPVSTDTLFWY